MHFPRVLNLARQYIHILCLAAFSEKIKPLLYCTPRPTKDFWHLIMKDNPSHKDFISAARGALISQKGKKTAANSIASAAKL